MDGDRKIIQIIDVESNAEDESFEINFNVEIVDNANNSKILSKQGSILLQMDSKKMDFIIQEYSLH